MSAPQVSETNVFLWYMRSCWIAIVLDLSDSSGNRKQLDR